MRVRGERILLTIVLLLALYGCAQLIRWIAVRVLGPPRRQRGMQLIPMNGSRNELEAVLWAADMQRRWAWPFFPPERVVLVDTGMDADTRREAERFCGLTDSIELWDTAALQQYMHDFAQAGLQTPTE